MNVNVVCPHCMEVGSVEQKEFTVSKMCTKCGDSFLDAKPLTANAVILEYFMQNSDLPIVVDFWAPWCGPCISMAPHFEKAALAMPLKAQFIKINNDDEQSLGAKYQIASIPCVLVFKEGKEVDRFTGARDSKQIEDWVRKYV